MKCNGVGIPPTDTHTTSPYLPYSRKTHTDLASIYYSPSMYFPSESLTTLQLMNWWFEMLDLLIKAGYLLWLTHRIPPSQRRQIHAWSRAWPVTGWWGFCGTRHLGSQEMGSMTLVFCMFSIWRIIYCVFDTYIKYSLLHKNIWRPCFQNGSQCFIENKSVNTSRQPNHLIGLCNTHQG